MSSDRFPSGFRARVVERTNRTVKVKEEYPWDRNNPPSQTAGTPFHPRRVIANFMVVDESDRPVSREENLRVNLRVPYAESDLAGVGNEKRNLKLGVWLGEGEGWRVYPWEDLDDLNPGARSGTVEVEIEGKLADPPVAWGG